VSNYHDFLEGKAPKIHTLGLKIKPSDISPVLFDFQRDLVRWSVAKGRAALFADTGLGKTLMQLEWAQLLNVPTLFVAPLAVAQQTIREAEKLDMELVYARSQDDATKLTITNYEMVSHFDPDQFDAVVLDESSILKNYTGKTRNLLIDQFANTDYRLACTATPAPNDVTEFANHAEFLGVMRRVDMLATFFIHDDEGWRLKGHAHKPFYKWMASWAMSIGKPSDLGYDDADFLLPELSIKPHIVHSDWVPDGQLFASHLKGITERTQVRKDTIEPRAERVAELVDGDHQWIIWVGLNDEQRAIADLIPDAVVVEGLQSPEEKAEKLLAFQDGKIRVLVTKPSIAGFGLNFQNCSRMVFNGIGDSYEQYYQAIRRMWRFGQTEPVQAHIVISDPEQHIYNNVLRKETEARKASTAMVEHVIEYEREELAGVDNKFEYATLDEEGDGWNLLLGDSCERLEEIEDDSVGLSIFSPPFESLYTYSPTERDLGNSSGSGEFWTHFSWISHHLLRVLMPGRLAAVHVQQLPTTKTVEGVIGLKDFRGATIAHFIEQGFIYHGEICIDKDPQAQAIRTKAKSLMFVQLHKDSSWMRPAFADYVLLFRKPGDNPEPIVNDWVSNDDWIAWARPIWYNIRETETLNVREARSNDDERHIAPLQLETIRRAVLLWSNPGDLILSPFAGIGSEGYESILNERRFVGVELKPEYFKVAVRNMRKAELERDSDTLLDLIDA